MQECSKCGKPYEGDACPYCEQEQSENAKPETIETAEVAQSDTDAQTESAAKPDGKRPLSDETVEMALKGHRIAKISRSLNWFEAIMMILYVLGIAFGVSSVVRGTYYLTMVALFAGVLFPMLLLFLPVRKWTPEKLTAKGGKKGKGGAPNGVKAGAIVLTVFWVFHLITLLAVNIKVVPEIVLPVPIVFSVMGLLCIVGLFFAAAAIERPRREVAKYFFGTETPDADAKPIVPFEKSQNAEVRKKGSIAKTWKSVLHRNKFFVYLCVCVGLAIAGTLTGVIGTQAYSDPFNVNNIDFMNNRTEQEVVLRRLGTPTVKSGNTFLYCNDEYAKAYKEYQSVVALGISDRRPDDWEERVAEAGKKLASIKTKRLLIQFDGKALYSQSTRDDYESYAVQSVVLDAVARADLMSDEEQEEAAAATDRTVTEALFADSGNCLAGADYEYKRFYLTVRYKDGSYAYQPIRQKALQNAGVNFEQAGEYKVELGDSEVPFTVTDTYTYDDGDFAFKVENDKDGFMTFTWQKSSDGKVKSEYVFKHLGDDGKSTDVGNLFTYYNDADAVVIESGVAKIASGTFNWYGVQYAVIEPGVKEVGAQNFGHEDKEYKWDENTPVYRDSDENAPLDAYKDGYFVPSVVYYHGTRAQWKNDLGLGYDADFKSNNKVCFYSETQPSGNDNYWHYVDGKPVEWNAPEEA